MKAKPTAYADGERRTDVGGISLVASRPRLLYRLPEMPKRGLGGAR